MKAIQHGGARLLRYESSIEAMGAVTSVVAHGDNADVLKQGVAAALAEMRRLDNLLSNYKASSEWSQMNRLAGHSAVAVCSELFDLLVAAQQYSLASEGAFDLSVGPLLKIWGFYKGSGRMADVELVRRTLELVDYRNVILNPAERTVRFMKPEMDLDPGGLGKGYALDRMVRVLGEHGIHSALLSAAGSSIYGLGHPPDKAGWPVQITGAGGRPLVEVLLNNESLSTSGARGKFFEAEGKRWSHIMDPRTGFPSGRAASVTVIAEHAIDSEVWAKPYYIHGRVWTMAHKPKRFRVFLCEQESEDSCGWIDEQGTSHL